VGWNFTTYDNLACCQCEELEKGLIDKLKMRKEVNMNKAIGNLLNRKE
jgi:hypothetical protein